MISRRNVIEGGALLVMAGIYSSQKNASAEPETWSGILEVGHRLRLRLEITAGKSVTLLSIDQGSQPIPGNVLQPGADQIEFVFPLIDGRFIGRKITPNQIEGTWHQGGGSYPLIFQQGEEALGPLPPLQPLSAERLRQLRLEAGAPGMGVASSRRGAPSNILIDGERQIETGVAIEKGDKWHLGSITKSMTATLIARLVAQGVVGWDDTVGDLLDSIVPDMHESYREANFRHLLSHRSGMQKDIPVSDFMKFSREISDAREERRAYARLALSMAPQGPVAETFEYANNGYVVAAAMLEAKLGRSWEALIRTHLFEPLGLSTAGFGAPGRAGALDQPVGHAPDIDNERLRAYPVSEPVTDNPAVLGPAGRVHINLSDFLVYLTAHRDTSDYLPPDAWRVLHTPPFHGDYAMGWVVREGGSLWHNGSNTLWYAEALVDARSETVAIAATNTGDLARAAPSIGSALLEAMAL